MANIKRCIALTLLLLLPGAVRSEVKVPPDCRVKNRPPGRCGWCSLETLARFHHLKVLYNLTDANATTCDESSLEAVLARVEVPYRIQHCGKTNQAILNYAIEHGLGAVIGFRELYPGSGGHIVTLIDITKDKAKVIDSNDQDGRIREMSLDRFLYWWDGFALVLDVQDNNGTTPSPNAAPATKYGRK
jgi:ABC-type bacteriocin/lantibiotic exporter with double-glycine peptidase domain